MKRLAGFFYSRERKPRFFRNRKHIEPELPLPAITERCKHPPSTLSTPDNRLRDFLHEPIRIDHACVMATGQIPAVVEIQIDFVGQHFAVPGGNDLIVLC